MRNPFLERSYLKYGGETSCRPLSNKSKLSMCLDQQSEILQFVFIVCPSHGLPRYIEIKVVTTYFYLI